MAGLKGGGEEEEKEVVSLPLATVKRIVESVLPTNVKASKAGGEAINACCGELIRALASEANRHCIRDSKRTISADHMEKAIEMIFPEAIETEQVPKKGKSSSTRRRKGGGGAKEDDDDQEEEEEGGGEVEEETKKKKQRRRRKKKLTKEEEEEMEREQELLFASLGV